ncbi:MAG: calcium-binding protein [Pseudomonadota bacterium]
MNSKTLLATAVALALTSVAPSALAQGDEADKSFDELDVNGDFLISAEEAKGDPDVASQFSSLDVNGDGYVDAKEFSRLDRGDKRYQ